jgi:hypothetical protein
VIGGDGGLKEHDELALQGHEEAEGDLDDELQRLWSIREKQLRREKTHSFSNTLGACAGSIAAKLRQFQLVTQILGRITVQATVNTVIVTANDPARRRKSASLPPGVTMASCSGSIYGGMVADYADDAAATLAAANAPLVLVVIQSARDDSHIETKLEGNRGGCALSPSTSDASCPRRPHDEMCLMTQGMRHVLGRRHRRSAPAASRGRFRPDVLRPNGSVPTQQHVWRGSVRLE